MKTTPLLATSSKRPPSLPSKCCGGGRDVGAASEGAQRTPVLAGPSARHRFGAAGVQEPRSRPGCAAVFALHRDLLRQHRDLLRRHPQSRPMGAHSSGTGSAATPLRGDTGQQDRGYLGAGRRGQGGLGAPGPAGRSSPVLLAGTGPAPAPVPRFLIFRTLLLTQQQPRRVQGGSCKKLQTCLFFSLQHTSQQLS